MRKKLIVFFSVVAGIGIIAGSVAGVGAIRNEVIVDKLDKMEITMTPTIDFVQPYMFAHNEGKSFNYDKYFSDLESVGYDTIIVQMTRTEEADGSSTFYYPTSITENTEGVNVKANLEYSYILEELLTACDERGFDVYMGLSVEEYSWWALTCYYDETYMNHCANTDVYMVQEIYDQFNSHKSFIGWYFAYELFSNPIGWESLWANNVNAVVDKIDSLNDNRPILFSPFRQIQLGLITNEYLMWKNFFKKTHLRSIDIFCPQDSIGKLDEKDNPHTSCDKDDYKRVYDYIDQTAKAAKEAGVHYYVNCELFRAVNGDSAYLYVGDINRVVRQIKNASRQAEKLVTFSASHYFLENETGVDTKEARESFFNDYKKVYNSLSK